MRFLLKNSKYGPSLVKMGIRHGKDFDCYVDTCPVCKPYRDKEKEEWDEMTQEEKEKVHFGHIG